MLCVAAHFDQVQSYRTDNTMLLMGEDFHYKHASGWYVMLLRLVAVAHNLSTRRVPKVPCDLKKPSKLSIICVTSSESRVATCFGGDGGGFSATGMLLADVQRLNTEASGLNQRQRSRHARHLLAL